MDGSKRYIRLGLFVTASVSILLVTLTVLGSQRWFQPTFTFETYFDQSIAGLAIGAPANFRGVPLGQVTEILTSAATYEPDVPIHRRRDYIIVRVKANLSAAEATQMKQDIATLIKRGLRAQTQLAGITGQQYLELDFLAADKYPPLPFAWTPRYTYLPSAPSVAGEIIAKAQAFLASLDDADISTLGRNLNGLVAGLNSKLGELPVAELSARAEEVLQGAETLLTRIDRILAAAPVEQTLRRLDSAAGRLDALLDDPSLGQTLDNTAAISARLRKLSDEGDFDRLVKRMDEAAGRLDAVLGDNQYDVRVIVQDLRATTDNLRALSETIKSDPAGVLLGGPPSKIKLPEQTP